LEERSLTPAEAARRGLTVKQDGVRRSALRLLGTGRATPAQLRATWAELEVISDATFEHLETDARYETYLVRQSADIEAFRRDEALALPPGLDYTSVPGLSNEVRAKLARARPASLGAASRIPGITPAALTRLLGVVRRDRRRGAA
jgi:tRNA uridine 5-carboxymethylaminomethyl modification enzyme